MTVRWRKAARTRGPWGSELFLAALGGCFMSNLLEAINARQAQVSDVQTDVTATLAERRCIILNTPKGKLDLQVRIGTLA